MATINKSQKIKHLQSMLENEQVGDLSAVVLAKRKLDEGDYDQAIRQLRVDADKFICVDYELFRLVMDEYADL